MDGMPLGEPMMELSEVPENLSGSSPSAAMVD